MDSSIPPPPSRARNKLRPWYLVAAMVVTWFVGIQGLSVGINTAAFLRTGTLPEAAAADVPTLAYVQETARLEALRAILMHTRITFPLSIAEVLLSALLVVASGLAMGGRRGARSLALQALGAYAIFIVASFLLTPSVRAAALAGFLHGMDAMPASPIRRELVPGFMRWAWLVKLVVIDLGTLALGALALTRARTKKYFEAVARAAESADDP